MKRTWFAILLTLAMLLSLTACGKNEPPDTPAPDTPPAEQTEPEPEALAALRQEIAAQNALLGVAFLGFVGETEAGTVTEYLEANGFYEVFPVLEYVTEESLVEQEGGELYLVVPASTDMTLTVSGCTMDETDYTLQATDTLLQVTDGRPLLLRGNVSEILPNLMLQAELADSTLEYAPCLSLMDGSLTEAEGILDLSDYGFLLQLWTETDGAYDAPIFCGTWYTRLMDDQNQIRMLKLILHEGGMVEYTYGSPEKEILEGFSGTWQEDGTLLRLDLYGGPIGSWNGEEQPEGYNYALIGAFEWDYQSGFLVLSHAEGDPLFYTGEIPYGWYEFLPFDAYKLAGSWVAATDYRDWEYRLNLLENGECHLDITEYGQELTCYAGWWTEADGLLELSVGLQSGQHPENPEWTALSGSYRAERSGDTLTLDFESGSILTLDMEGYGWESFVLE